jgi:hypothetical protein
MGGGRRIFRQYGDSFRVAHAGHLSRSQLRVMGAIEACRTSTIAIALCATLSSNVGIPIGLCEPSALRM